MNPTIEWCDIKSRRCLVLHFDRYLSEEDAQNAVSQLTSMIGPSSDKVVMVKECTRMTDYDSGAREAWQKFIKNIKSRLEAIHLVSNNFLIRIGATAIGVFAGIKIHAWADMEQFHTGF
jgi:hypothetical protein